MSIYEKDDGRVKKIAEAMLTQYHGELQAAGVKIDYLVAHAKTDKNDDPIGAALKHQGYACGAIVKVIGLKDRTKGMGDAEIIVDGDRWDEWSEEQKAALIDHELTHLELIPDGEGAIKRDDLGRPRLRCRLHDRQFGWFDSVARRHSVDAFEVQQAIAIVGNVDLRQLYLPGFEVKQVATADEVRAAPRLPPSDDEQAQADEIMKRMGHNRTDGGDKKLKVSVRGGPLKEMSVDQFTDEVVRSFDRQKQGSKRRAAAHG